MRFYKSPLFVFGVGVPVTLLVVYLAARGVMHYANSGHGDTSILGLSVGTIALIVAMLFVLAIAGFIALLVRSFRSGTTAPAAPTPPPASTTPSTTPATPPAPTTPPAPKKKKSRWLGKLIGWCFVLFLFFGACSQILDMTRSQWKPQRPCANVEQLNEEGVYDFSKKTSDTPAFIDPGSGTELCFGAWVTIPDKLNGHNWDVLFADPNATRDGCVAWLEYPGVEKIYGAYQGDREIGEDNRPLRWRVATNCRIGIYPRG